MTIAFGYDLIHSLHLLYLSFYYILMDNGITVSRNILQEQTEKYFYWSFFEVVKFSNPVWNNTWRCQCPLLESDMFRYTWDGSFVTSQYLMDSSDTTCPCTLYIAYARIDEGVSQTVTLAENRSSGSDLNRFAVKPNENVNVQNSLKLKWIYLHMY